MSIFSVGGGNAAADYEIDQSLRVTGGKLIRTPSSAGNRKTWTYSAWVKRSTLDNGSSSQGDSQSIFSAGPSSSQYFYLAFSSSVYSAGYQDSLYIDEYSFGQRIQKNTSQKFRDIGGWYHIVLAFDTTQATAANRIKVYVNGEQVTDWARDTNPSLNYDGLVNATNFHGLGEAPYGSGAGYWQYHGYLAEVNFIDGQALAPASFGETNSNTNQWQAIEYEGSYGNNGFYLPFSNGSDWSYRFDGNGDWITVPSNSGNPFDFGTGDFTIEGWFYTQRNGSGIYYWGISQGGGASQKINFGDASGNGTLGVDINGTTVIYSSTVDTLDKWVHLAVVREGTGTNQLKLYANGTLVGSATSSVDFTSFTANFVLGHNGEYWPSAAAAFEGYISNFRVVKGTAVYTSSFTPSGSPLTAISGTTYLTAQSSTFVDNSSLGQTVTVNGNTYADKNSPFQLDFADDHSGNANNFAPSNLNYNDVVIDSPTNNFATLNPLMTTGTNYTYSEGNLKYSTASFRNGCTTNSIAMTSGKWYWEIVMTTNGSTAATHLGVVGMGAGIDHKDSYNPRFAYQPGTGNWWQTGSNSSITSSAVGDIIGFALDVDSDELSIYKNNSSILSGHSLPTNSDGGWLVQLLGEGLGNTMAGVVNFGQDSSFAGEKTAQGNGGVGEDFYYTPPTGYKALNTDNLDDPAIDLPTEHFNTILWTGDNTSPRSFSGVGFSPDFVWTKSRSSSSWWNIAFDRLRGGGQLVTSQNDAELVQGSNLGGYVSSYDTDGFTATSGSVSNGSFNNSGDTYVAWNWKAGGTASSNSDGTITSSVSANPTSGFSIASYTGNATTGATVGHGLSQAPEMLIVKQRDAVKNWSVLANSDPTDYLMLNSDNATADDSGFWNDTNPSASVFTLGSLDWVNDNTNTYIAYCFHSVDGYSKVGSYVGNDSPDGPFITTGFRPAFLMLKAKDRGDDWIIVDNKRDSYNILTRKLNPNTNGAEITNHAIVDFVSNGFKIRDNSDKVNLLNSNYFYLAFAESPFKYSNAR